MSDVVRVETGIPTRITVITAERRGPPGAGEKGDKGDAGFGIPTGGYQGQVLMKSSTTDFDAEWSSAIDAGEFM